MNRLLAGLLTALLALVPALPARAEHNERRRLEHRMHEYQHHVREYYEHQRGFPLRPGYPGLSGYGLPGAFPGYGYPQLQGLAPLSPFPGYNGGYYPGAYNPTLSRFPY